MKNKKGFTLVELLAVIVVLGIIMVIVIPAVSNNSKTAKEAVLKTKVNLVVDQASIWGEDNINYFLTSNKGPLKDCTEAGNEVTCKLTFNDLAEAGYVKYDDEEKKLITDPTKNRASLNDEIVLLTYDKSTRKVSSKLDPNSTLNQNS